MANNYWKAMMIMESNRKRWLKLNPNLSECSGIYILTRVDEKGFKYAYVGQAKKILTRLAQHLMQYGHIDLSLKKHKLYDAKTNPCGYKVEYIMLPEDKLDEWEQKEILHYANLGYQMRNRTSGSQGKGKSGIADDQTTKNYRDGLKQGYKNAFKDIRVFFDKYLDYMTKTNKECFRKNGRLKQIYKDKFDEFTDLLEEKDE